MLCVYRIERKIMGKVPAFLKSIAKDHAEEGVANITDVVAFEAGKSASIKSKEQVYLTSQAFLDDAQKIGFPQAQEKHVNDLRSDVFTAIAVDGLDPALLTRVDFGSHMLFCLNGEVRPTAIHFSYIDGGLSNGYFDLEKSLKALQANPRITFLGARRSVVEKGEILAIPYYNVSKGKSHYLDFYFGPSFEEMQVLWAKMNDYGQGNKYPSSNRHRAVLDLDMLGLAKADPIVNHETEHDDD